MPDPDASLAAEVGGAVFRVAFERWIAGSPKRRLATIMRTTLDSVTALTSAGA